MTSLVNVADNPYGFTFLHPSGEGINHMCAELPQVLADMQTLGCKWLRFQLPWKRIEASQGVYTLGALDETINACNAAGINIQYTIQGTPNWWATRTCSCDNSYAFADITGTNNFVSVLAARYNGVFNVPGFGNLFLNSIEIGNEDYDLFGSPQCCRDLGGQYLAPVLVECVPTILALSPNCLVGPGSLLTQNDTHYANWIDALFAGGAGPYLSYINVHFYKSGGNPPTNGFSIQEAIADVQKALQKRNYGYLTVWITETGWPINSTGHSNSDVVTYSTQWSYFQQMLDFSRTSGNQVSHLFWFTIGKNDGDSLTQGGAIDGSPYSRVPAFSYLQNYIQTYPQWVESQSTNMADFFNEPNPSGVVIGTFHVQNDTQTATSGNLVTDNNATISGNLTVSNLATLGQVAGGVKNGGAASLAATISSAATITLGTFRVVRVQTSGASVTSVALATGTVDGQDLTVVNVSATAMTISTNVGAATTVPANGAASFTWDAGTTLWYHKA